MEQPIRWRRLSQRKPRRAGRPAADGPPSSLAPDLLRKMDAYWRAANYLSVGQIYLLDNPLLREPLKLEHVKPRLLGHWGTTPGQNFIYVHLNRIIKEYDLNMIYISGPGHGGPALVANTYLEGTYSELYPNITQDEAGHEAAVQAVLLPRRHPQPRRARDAGLDPRGGRAGLQPQPRLRRGVRQPRPDRRLRRRRRRGRDRPAGHRLALATSSSTRRTTAPCCRSSTSTATRSPTRPSWPASAARSWSSSCAATATRRTSSRGTSPRRCTSSWRRRSTGSSPRSGGSRRTPASGASPTRPRWPMIVLETPKGWTGPKVVDGQPVEGTFRAHQVPLSEPTEHPEHLKLLEDWMRSYRPEELFDEHGPARPRAGRAGPRGRAADGRQPARQRRHPAARPAAARLPRLRRRRAAARRRHERGRAHAGQVPPRRDQAQRRTSATSASSAPTRPPRTA